MEFGEVGVCKLVFNVWKIKLFVVLFVIIDKNNNGFIIIYGK